MGSHKFDLAVSKLLLFYDEKQGNTQSIEKLW